jgi:hypothetical protein
MCFSARNLRQITFKNKEKDFPKFYQHKESLGLEQCKSNLPAAVQGDIHNSVQFTEKITLIISNTGLGLVSTLECSVRENCLVSFPHPLYRVSQCHCATTVNYEHFDRVHNKMHFFYLHHVTTNIRHAPPPPLNPCL